MFWKKKKPDPILQELRLLNKNLTRLVECIDHNSRYGGAVRTVPAKRY